MHRLWSTRRCTCPSSMGMHKGWCIQGQRPRCPLCRMGASAPMPRPGRSIYDLTWCGRMGNLTMPVTWITPGNSGSIPSLELQLPLDPNLDQLGRCFSRPPLDYFPSHSAICSFPPILGGWLLGSATRAPFQFDGTRGNQEVARQSESQVTSGPFMMAESVPGDHYTLVRNPQLLPRQRRAYPTWTKWSSASSPIRTPSSRTCKLAPSIHLGTWM